MFERFTERAVNVVSESQRLAQVMGCKEVSPEHLLLALVNEAKGVSLKLFRMYKMLNLYITNIKSLVTKVESDSLVRSLCCILHKPHRSESSCAASAGYP